ncbi:DNA-processing protein DprA [Halomontanus rarus]|uniref:DNA-processing protein DprA n=1 Tax=Halomontanus rarus TaxID=3034020 RepID=UPI001A981101
MNDLDPIIAGLNDKQDLNDKTVLDLFTDLFVEKGPKEVTQEFLLDFLRIKVYEGGERSELASKLVDGIESIDVDFYTDYLREIDSDTISFAPFYSPEYPDRLWKIPDPPLCLYIDGDMESLDDGVAVVGTRSAKEHRLEFVHEIAHALVKMDKTVVSGLANGVDAAAHQGALDAGGETVAVLPGEVQKIVPAGNRDLGDQIREQGALVSETSSKVGIHRGRFVERNRVTSGISTAVIIGASGETGGTIHQADFAQEQEKPRFLYDPEIDDGQSPTKVFDKGFRGFKNIDELKELLNSDFSPSDPKTPVPTELDDYDCG